MRARNEPIQYKTELSINKQTIVAASFFWSNNGYC